jgi:hypothetical protein
MITADELLEHIKKHGITKARTEKDLILNGYIEVTKGTILYFGENKVLEKISSYSRRVDNLNKQFNYNFDYEFSELWHIRDITFTILDEVKGLDIKTNEVKKMELKDIKKTNLKEAKKQYETEKANAEIIFAKQQLRIAEDEIDELDRQIKKLVEDKKPYEDIIKMFKDN